MFTTLSFPIVLWYIAICVWFLSFLIKNDKKLLQVNALFNILMWSHLYLLWWFSGAYTLFFDAFKNILSTRYKYNIPLLAFFTLVNIGILFLTFDGSFLSLFPWIASISWTAGIFLLTWIRLRFLIMFVIVTWFLYNLSLYSIPWMLGSSGNFIAVLIWTLRILFTKSSHHAK